MATRFESWSHEQICSFFSISVGETCKIDLNLQADGRRWRRKFNVLAACLAAGRENVSEEDSSGRPSRSTTDMITARLEKLIQGNKRITIRHMMEELGMSFERVRHIVHYILQYRKVYARWVPRNVIDQHRQSAWGASLQRLSTEGNSFLLYFDKGNEIWIHHYTPSSKRSTVEWNTLPLQE